METILVGAIIAGAGVWFVLWLRKMSKGEGGCGCGCNKCTQSGCASKPERR